MVSLEMTETRPYRLPRRRRRRPHPAPDSSREHPRALDGPTDDRPSWKIALTSQGSRTIRPSLLVKWWGCFCRYDRMNNIKRTPAGGGGPGPRKAGQSEPRAQAHAMLRFDGAVSRRGHTCPWQDITIDQEGQTALCAHRPVAPARALASGTPSPARALAPA